MTKPKILCYIRDTGPLGGIIWAAEGDPGAMAVVEADGQLTATPLHEGAGSGVEALDRKAAIAAWEEISNALPEGAKLTRADFVAGILAYRAFARATFAKVEAAS